MRDGIPRTIPVPRKWQAVVECADRPADRGTNRVVEKLLDASRSNFAKYFPAEQRKSLIEIADDSQLALPGLGVSDVFEPKPQLPGQSHHLQELLGEARELVRKGHEMPTALRDALAAKIESDIVAHRRQISEDLASKCSSKELQRVEAEINRAAGLIDPVAEANRLLQKPSREQRLNGKIRPDEDLRK